MWHWLLHITGADNVSGAWYGFWSGFGSDLTEFAVLGGIWHALNCHETGCWRIGHRMTVEADGRHVRRCRRHHTIRHTTEGTRT